MGKLIWNGKTKVVKNEKNSIEKQAPPNKEAVVSAVYASIRPLPHPQEMNIPKMNKIIIGPSKKIIDPSTIAQSAIEACFFVQSDRKATELFFLIFTLSKLKIYYQKKLEYIF